MSNNFGSSWQSIEGNLPDVPCNDIIADPTRDSILYVATDIGVYITYDMGQSWDLFGTSMPVVPVTDLRFHQPTMTLIAATYGRSLYTIDLTAAFVGTGKEIAESTVEVYPNPADKNFNVRFYSPSYSTGKISIKDVSGRSVYEDRLNVQSGLNAIEINQSFSQGIYIVRVQVGDKSYVGKLVIR
jgi:hypothetical protein